MIQKKKFSDAIAANISVVGGLIGVATTEKDGLMSKKSYQRFYIENYDFDLNNSKVTGYAFINTWQDIKNAPDEKGIGVIEVWHDGSNYIIQKITFYTPACIYVRAFNDSTYNQWTKIS